MDNVLSLSLSLKTQSINQIQKINNLHRTINKSLSIEIFEGALQADQVNPKLVFNLSYDSYATSLQTRKDINSSTFSRSSWHIYCCFSLEKSYRLNLFRSHKMPIHKFVLYSNLVFFFENKTNSQIKEVRKIESKNRVECSERSIYQCAQNNRPRCSRPERSGNHKD